MSLTPEKRIICRTTQPKILKRKAVGFPSSSKLESSHFSSSKGATTQLRRIKGLIYFQNGIIKKGPQSFSSPFWTLLGLNFLATLRTELRETHRKQTSILTAETQNPGPTLNIFHTIRPCKRACTQDRSYFFLQ